MLLPQREFSRVPRSPSIVPQQADHDIYLVLNDFGRLGRAWCEADEEGTDRKTLIRRLLDDQYSHPVRIVAFNTAEGWSRDVTIDIADELRRRVAEYDEVPPSVQKFVEAAVRR
jgi:hypothetical protein